MTISHEGQAGDDGTGPHRVVVAGDAEPSRARGHGRGGLPLQEVSLPRDQAGQRDRDRIEHVPRLMREECEMDADARQIGADVFGPRAQEHPQPDPLARTR